MVEHKGDCQLKEMDPRIIPAHVQSLALKLALRRSKEKTVSMERPKKRKHLVANEVLSMIDERNAINQISRDEVSVSRQANKIGMQKAK